MIEFQVNINIITSVLIPLRNEEKYIKKCIESLLLQDYPNDKIEILFIDGDSKDATCKIIQAYIDKYPYIYLIHNPNKTVPFAMNIGIKKSNGQYIIRLDAHSEYAPDYVSKCIEYLEKTDADNVGGVVKTQGEGFKGRTIASMLSTRFGVGNSSFRIGVKDGYVDTVPFGAFRKEVFDKYGLYNERLTRNQDIEMNYRIRRHGGKIFITNDIKLTYFCQNTLNGIQKKGFEDGKWNIFTSFLCPGTMGIRHYIPFLFVLFLVLMPIILLITQSELLKFAFIAELSLYFILDLMYSLNVGIKFGIKHVLFLIILFPIFHISYGLGSLFGLIKYVTNKKEFI